MPTQIRVTRANKKQVDFWTRNFRVGTGEAPDIAIFASPFSPGRIVTTIGDVCSPITPHQIEASISIEELSRDIAAGHFMDNDAETLRQWRDCFERGLRRIDKALAKATR